jgi:hypothetical protein
VTREGPCAVVQYFNTTFASTLMPNVSAGVIAISGGKVPVTLTPDAQNLYPRWQDMVTGLWDGGETIAMSAAGATVPAFNYTFTAPSLVEVTNPVFFGVEPIDRTKDYTVTWSGGAVGTFQVTLAVTINHVPIIALYCDFPSVAGMGTIPAAALARLPANTMGAFAVVAGGVDWFGAQKVGAYWIPVFVDGLVRQSGIPTSGGGFATVN